MSTARCSIEVDGLVQGVGFRPFVHGLADRLGLAGFVQNCASGVHIEVEGEEGSIDVFVSELRAGAPSAAAVGTITRRPAVPRGEPEFHITASAASDEGRFVAPADLSTCRDCLRELFDENDRRRGHSFITCTQCGPRASIISDLPYDRERTTMAVFALCAACEREYREPSNRRFHAEPIACPSCGPRLALFDAGRRAITGDPLEGFAASVEAGHVGALKGIGGFHLVCDATNDAAVADLRRRKRRERKPFAVMVPDLGAAERVVLLDERSRKALCSPAAPIVLARARAESRLSLEVAPGIGTVGVLLPYTPVHHALMRRLGRPIVVTSGNISDEPIARTDDEAFAALGAVADLFLTHDRPIHLRMEDSVVRAAGDRIVPIRRSRGFAPLPVTLPFTVDEPTLALGGNDKSAFCLAYRRSAVLGPHLGELGSLAAYGIFSDAVRHFERLFRIRPERLVHDMHPDYATTRYALERAAFEPGLERIAVQHHHAHVASAMAENGLDGDVIGVAFDGTGFGTDGSLWGGEFFVGGYRSVERAAFLRPAELPGGDRAAREPWRSALAHLCSAGLSSRAHEFLRDVDARSVGASRRLIERRVACATTSSVGRLFDAVAALSGVAPRSAFEGEAAMRLEALAALSNDGASYPTLLAPYRGSRKLETPLTGAAPEPFVVDVDPTIRDVVGDVARGVSVEVIARRFHSAVVEMIGAVCLRLRHERGLERVVLSGGVFQNAILAREVPAHLEQLGFSVWAHSLVPPNDGGLALGQLAVSAHATGTKGTH